ncbi:hypothetical protein M0812_12224 [Anaeramoeba flamelloides]|uniref:Dystroglycan-type cadherin-like domain-containing protein n=1 Tax=Anaeramoeba flamelloides TaxID=1746091 RepID=A0AAV7ZQ53_9EUKA|nr:hypothetical protein M0812_12224 [Anaeramoeba flamelloides]
MNKLLIFFFIVAFISSVFTEDSCLFALDDELIVNAEDQSEDKLSSIATLSDTIHTVMVWRSSNDEDGYNIKIAILKTSDTDSGAVPEHVYGPIKLETSHDYNTYPDVTALEDNEFIVTFSAGTSDEDLDIYAIGYSYTTDDKFETLSNEYMINTETDDNQEYPTARMVHDSSNTEQKKVLFVWSSKNQDPVQSGVVASYGVYAQLYDVTDVENFQSLGAELRINDEIPNSQFKQHMWAHTTDGSVVVVWESANQDGFASGVYGRVIECTGDLADFKSDEFQVNGNNLYNQYQIAVAGSRQEGSYQVVFTWASKHAAQSYYEIFQRPMDLDPTKYVDNKPIFLSNDTLVSQNSDSNSYDMEDPMITFTQQSNYVVIGWTSENQDYGLNSLTKKYEYSDGVYFRIFDLIDWDSTGLKDINEETAIHSELSFDQSEVKMDYFGTSDDIIFSWSSGSGLQKSEVKTRLWGFGGIAPTSNYDMVDQTLQSGIVHTYVTDDVIFEDQNGDDLIFNLYKAGTTDAIEDWIDFSVSADDKFIFVFTTPTSCDDVIEIEVEASNACGGSIRKPLQLTITNDSPTYYDTEDVSVTISTPDLPSFLGYDQATNIISGTAPDGCSADGENSFDITIEAFDTCSQSSSVTFTVDITNEDPTYDGNMEAQSVKAGSSEEYDISGFFSDPEDGTLTFTFEYQSLSGTGPTWNKLDSTTGIFDWDVPDSQKAASYTIIVTAKDDCGKSNSGSFGLTIVNQAPQATASYEEENIDAGSSWTKLIEIGAIVDPEGATITYSAEAKSGEQWWAFNSVSRTFSGTAPDVCSEPYEIRLIGTDPSGQTANIEFSVKVGNNQYPTVIGTIDTISAVENHDFTHTFDLESLFADENYGTLTFSVTNEDDSTLDSLFYTYPDTIYNKPMPIYCGSSISYKLWATDECGQSTSITFMVQSTNSGPEIQDTLEDETFSISTSNTYYDIMSNDITSFTDPNNEDLEFSYYYIEDNGDKILVNWITLQESGDRIYLDLNLEGLCSETHTLEVNATDKCKNSVIQTFEINIVNDEPIVDPSNLLAGSTYTWEKNQEFSHIIGNPFIDDESDDELTFVLNQVVDGTLEDLPYIMSFEQETFTLKWNTYDLSDICDEVFHLRYTVSDRCGQSASVDFYVDFQTKQPIIIDGGIQDDTVSTEQVTYRVEYGKKFNDEDQETLTFDIYLLDDTNEEETIDNYHWITNIVEKENYQERYMDLNLNEQCDDVHNFIVYAKDGCNMQVRETFAITVVNNDPYIIDGASLKNGLYTGYYGQEFTLELGNVFADDDDDSVFDFNKP